MYQHLPDALYGHSNGRLKPTTITSCVLQPTYRYIDDFLSINNHNFHNYVYLTHPYELEIKDTTESDISVSYLDLLANINSNGRWQVYYMSNVMTLTLPLSSFLFYVGIHLYHFHLFMVCISPWIDTQFQSEANLTTNKNVDVIIFKILQSL
jgi:hypothetical protein